MDLTQKVLADPAFTERYELHEKLGQGGMGSVHRGVQRALNRPVAIKFMVPDLAGEQGYVERFLAEARLAASLIHSNVVAVFDYGLAGAVPYLVTEYVAGRTLADLLKERPLTVEETIAISRDVLDGLTAIHKLGIVHRDIKPANIVVVPGSPPSAKILDFGIAKQTSGALLGDDAPKTATGLVMGTPEFMAPEQAVGDPVTPAADLYAFTLMLYRIIVGRPPFQADTVLELLRMHVHHEPPIPDDLLPAVRDLLARGLAKKPADRLNTGPAMRSALDRAAAEAFATATFKATGGEVTSVTPPQSDIATSPRLPVAEPTVAAPTTPPLPPSRAKPFVIGAAALALVVALGLSASGPGGFPPVILNPDELPTVTVKARNVYRDENRLTDYAKPDNLTLKNPRKIDDTRIDVDVILTKPNNNLQRSGFSDLLEPPDKPGMVHTVWSTSQPLWLMPIGFCLEAEAGGAAEIAWRDAQPRGIVELDLIAVRSGADATAVIHRLRVHLDRAELALYVSDPDRCTTEPRDATGEKRTFAWREPWRIAGRWSVAKESLTPAGTARLTVTKDGAVAKVGSHEQRLALAKPFALEPGYLYPRLHFYEKTDLVLERMTLSGDVRRNY